MSRPGSLGTAWLSGGPVAGLQCTVFGQKSSAEGCCALARVGASSTSSPTPSATHTPPTSQQRRVRRLCRCRFPVAYGTPGPCLLAPCTLCRSCGSGSVCLFIKATNALLSLFLVVRDHRISSLRAPWPTVLLFWPKTVDCSRPQDLQRALLSQRCVLSAAMCLGPGSEV